MPTSRKGKRPLGISEWGGESIPIHHAPAHYGVRTKDYKLIHYYGAGLGVPGSSDRLFKSEWELYDLQKDPAELTNVADDPAYAETRASLTTRLAELQAHYADLPYEGPSTPAPSWSWLPSWRR